MIRPLIAVWAGAFAAATLAVLALLSLPSDVRNLGRPLPEAQVYFIGTSLIGHAIPPYGTGALYDGMSHIRLSYPSISEWQALDLAEAALDSPQVKVIALEAYPFLRDFHHIALAAAHRSVLEDLATKLLTTTLQVTTAARAIAWHFGIGIDPMARFLEERPIDSPGTVTEARLRRIYPLHVRDPNDLPRLQRFVAKAHSRGIEVWLIVPPRSDLAAKLTGPERIAQLSAAIDHLAQTLGCRLFAPASSWPDHLYRDPGHLNREGRARFLTELKAAAGGQP